MEKTNKRLKKIYRYMSEDEFNKVLNNETIISKRAMYFINEKNGFFSTVLDKDCIYSPEDCECLFNNYKKLILVEFGLNKMFLTKENKIFNDPYDKTKTSKICIQTYKCNEYDTIRLKPIRYKRYGEEYTDF